MAQYKLKATTSGTGLLGKTPRKIKSNEKLLGVYIEIMLLNVP